MVGVWVCLYVRGLKKSTFVNFNAPSILWRRCEYQFLPLDFIPGRGSLCGSCYKLFTEPETWNNAAAKCKSLGAELVKIESAEEQDFLMATFFTASVVTYWIGLSDQVEEGKWIRTDGSLYYWQTTPTGEIAIPTTRAVINIVAI